jgi:uncharacterized protein YigE (DUF2233 family)
MVRSFVRLVVAALLLGGLFLVATRPAPRLLDPAAPGPLVRLHHDGGVEAFVAEVPLDRFRIRLERDEAGTPLEGPGLVRMNAGIFEPGFVPSGLLVRQGVPVHPLNTGSGSGNFYLAPNGVFAITGAGATVVETSKFPSLQDVREATQSGPLLVRRGVLHPALREGSRHRFVRNGVGVRADGKVVFAVSRAPISLFDFAALFRDELACPDALYLDGFVSGLAVRGEAITDDHGPFAAVLVVEAR